MKNILICCIALMVANVTLAQFDQPGWNWPQDEELKSKALEAQANYKDILLPAKKYKETMARLNWLYTNTPDLHKSIYQDGEKCIREMMKGVKDAERINRLKDSTLWMYDQRIKYFDNDAYVKDRKVYKALQYFIKDKSKYEDLLAMYKEVYELNGTKVSSFNLSNYVYVATLQYGANPDALPKEEILDIFDLVSNITEQKIAMAKSDKEKAKLEKEQSKSIEFIKSIEGLLTCEFIEEKLVAKFRENPSDLATAKKIFKYSLQAKCTDQPYFLEACEPVFDEDPNFSLANAMASRYLAANEPAKALTLYEKAYELSTTSDDKFDALIGQATVLSKMGRKYQARSKAYEAISEKPEKSSEGYNIIGNLYFRSFNDCKKEQSKVEDRAVFIAAYKMYERAGNSAQMRAAKEQFPSIEEIFSENYQEGQSISTGCWINETVELMRR